MALRLDPVDWRILKELQADGSMTNVALASRVGLSAPPCLRRVRALEQAGLIAGYTVLLDEAALGFELTAFAMVGLHNQAEAELRAFENRVLGWPIVREAYMLSGESDYMLKCVAKDLPAFQEFVLGGADRGAQRRQRQDVPRPSAAPSASRACPSPSRRSSASRTSPALLPTVIPGLVARDPSSRELLDPSRTWIPATSAGMTSGSGQRRATSTRS